MVEYPYETPPPPVRDRKTRLIALGVLQLSFGALCALIGVLSLVGMIMASAMGPEAAAAGMNPSMMFMGVAVYGAIAAWFITMGVGSIMARRWARALILVSSWIWLAVGVSGTVFLGVFMGDIADLMGKDPQLPAGFAQGMKIAMVLFAALIYIALPATLVLFYRGKDVKATCEYRNPSPSWTDACPMPVLAHVLILSSYGVSILFMGGYNWVVPFFGVVLSGAVGALAVVLIGILSIGLAWGAYRLKPAAWWGTVVYVTAWCLSALITFLRVDLMDFYGVMGMPPKQLEMMRPLIESGGFTTPMLIGIPIWGIAILALLIYTKRYYAIAAPIEAPLS